MTARAHPLRPALSVDDLAIRYPGADRSVLEGFSLALHPGEIVAVLGPSGVGKSSLLRTLGGLLPPAAGSVWIGNQPLTDVHPRIAIAFQNPSLLPWLSLERNVAFGLDFARQPKLTAAERQARIDAAIAEVGLAQARHQSPAQLSGGMAQRTALARCLARRPDVLLLDEPFGALDEVTRADMQQLLLKLVDDHRTATLLITHDIDEALILADRVVLLGSSPARAVGEWSVDLAHPRTDAIEALGSLRIDILQKLRGSLRCSTGAPLSRVA